MEFLADDLLVLGSRNDVGRNDLGQQCVAGPIVAEIVASDHPAGNWNGQPVHQMQLVILHFEADTVGMGNGHNSLSLAFDGIASGNVPQIKVALGLKMLCAKESG